MKMITDNRGGGGGGEVVVEVVGVGEEEVVVEEGMRRIPRWDGECNQVALAAAE